jgi:L-asparaginase
VEMLREGAGPLDAVEAAIRLVEVDPSEHSVGVGGAPNVLGQVELDASIMDGRTLKSGAVGGLKDFIHPISVARQIMERLPHVFLVGDGAARFAREIEAETGPALTPEAETRWRAWLEANVPMEERAQWAAERPLVSLVWRTVRPETTHGTVVALARDRQGNFGGGVSTSGWGYKYPGRLGDSPVIGAGLYVDNRYGAAGCVGHGELTIRAGTARSVVLYLKMGATVREAVHEAAHDVRRLERDFEASLAIHALDHDGQPYVLMLGDDPGMRLYYYWIEGQEASEVAVDRANW